MSQQQMHSHGPGQPMHTHGPPGQQPPPQAVVPAPDPNVQALIDADYTPVDLILSADGTQALCAKNKEEKDLDSGVDFTATNRLARLLLAQPNLRCPPPPQIVTPKLSQVVNNTKEEGNQLFKAGQPDKAVAKYTLAANYAMQRPPWEASQLMRDELSTVISNRSAAYLESGDLIGALVDAETVIALKRPWSKGHFRKAKALVEMGELKEAKDAINLGLQFEPNNTEMNSFLAEIYALIKKAEEGKAAARASSPLAKS